MIRYSSDAIYLTLALGSAAIAAIYDLRERRIPNVLTASSILLGLMLHLAFGGWSQFAYAVLAGLLGGGILLILFLMGGMGAGDVKLMTAIGCLVGTPFVGRILLATVLIGGGLAIVLAIARGRVRQTLRNVGALAAHCQLHGLHPHDELSLDNLQTIRLPYALPIAAGCTTVLWMLVVQGR